MTGRNQHVVPRDGKWAVKPEGSDTPTSIHQTQRKAIDRAKSIAQNQESELLVHRKDGTIRERRTYGPDPYPPKG